MFGINNCGDKSHLVEFRAGRMNMIEKMVHADPEKGLVYMKQTEDGLMHFYWKNRGTGKVEEDLIVFPGEYEYKRVDLCKTGRVYVLKFTSSTRRLFYWMQEPHSDKDDEYCRRVNELLNNPPVMPQRRRVVVNNDLQSILNNISQQQLMQLFGNVGQPGELNALLATGQRSADGTRNPTRRRNGGSSGALARRATTGFKSRAGRTFRGARRRCGGSNANGLSVDIDLFNAIVGSDALTQLTTDPETAKSLCALLPVIEGNKETRNQFIRRNIQSPQFQEAMAMFISELQAAALGPVISQFQLPADAITAAYAGSLEGFVKALENAVPVAAEINDETVEESVADGSATAKDTEDKAEVKKTEK